MFERRPLSSLKANNLLYYWPRLLIFLVHLQICGYSYLLKVFLAKGLIAEDTGSSCGDKKLVLIIRRSHCSISDNLEPGAVSISEGKHPSLTHLTAR